MNLKNFLNYRHSCPLCNVPLSTYFHSKKHQIMKYEDGRIVFIFRMDGIKRGQSNFKVGYSFGLQDNSCFIEFYNKENVKMNDSPLHLLKKFKQLDKDIKEYNFYKICESCCNYNYYSNTFTFSFNGLIDNIIVANEYFGLVLPFGNKFKISKLTNNLLTNKSSFTYSKEDNSYLARPNIGYSFLEVINIDNIIKFTSIEETIDRISKLIIFS